MLFSKKDKGVKVSTYSRARKENIYFYPHSLNDDLLVNIGFIKRRLNIVYLDLRNLTSRVSTLKFLPVVGQG